MKLLFAVIRLVVAVGAIVAIVATFFDTASRTAINPFNFFGFFTMQANIIITVALLVAAFATFAGRAQTPGLVLLRACATTYIAVVGIVYNTLLTGLEGGVSLEWANTVLHVVLPIYAVADWILFGDRTAVPWKKLWLVVIYPIVWVVVVLFRGATDGWVPYPFLDPAQGYGVVALYCVAIAVATLVVAVGVWALSRVRILKP
ncbi:MAG: Pr6Pr family membrane protein [Rhodoglobus sp.]